MLYLSLSLSFMCVVYIFLRACVACMACQGPLDSVKRLASGWVEGGKFFVEDTQMAF